MNYNHINYISDYWEKHIFPNLHHHMMVSSFNDYLKVMSGLPSCAWMQESIKSTRIPFVVDPNKFVKEYANKCVAYANTNKPEDGLQRIIYQISPTLHLETALYVWVENEEVNAYLAMLACFKTEKELKHFFDDIRPMKMTGDTEETRIKAGFAVARAGFQP